MKIKFFSRIFYATIILAFGINLIGCGQRGPLYLPKDSAKDSAKDLLKDVANDQFISN